MSRENVEIVRAMDEQTARGDFNTGCSGSYLPPATVIESDDTDHSDDEARSKAGRYLEGGVFWIGASAGELRYIIAPVLVALAVSVFSDFGRHVNEAFFVTFAQVIPVIFLATLAAQFAAVRPVLAGMRSRNRDPGAPGVHRLILGGLALRFVGLFVTAEAAALVGVALGHSTTFLVVLSVLPVVVMLVSFIAATHDQHFFDLGQDL